MFALAFAAAAARAGEVELISRMRPGAASETAIGASFAPVVSADGRYVAFFSSARNLVPGLIDEDPSSSDLFLYDRLTAPMFW